MASIDKLVSKIIEQGLAESSDSKIIFSLEDVENYKGLKARLLELKDEVVEVKTLTGKNYLIGENFIEDGEKEFSIKELIGKIIKLGDSLSLENPTLKQVSIKDELVGLIKKLTEIDAKGVSKYFAEENFDENKARKQAEKYSIEYDELDDITNNKNFEIYVNTFRNKNVINLLRKIERVVRMEYKNEVDSSLTRLDSAVLKDKKIVELDLSDFDSEDLQDIVKSFEKIEQYELDKHSDIADPWNVFENKYLTPDQVKRAKELLLQKNRLKSVQSLAQTIKDIRKQDNRLFKKSIDKSLKRGIDVTQEQQTLLLENFSTTFELFGMEINESAMQAVFKEFNLDSSVDDFHKAFATLQVMLPAETEKQKELIENLKTIFEKNSKTMKWENAKKLYEELKAKGKSKTEKKSKDSKIDW